jgi:hypothetical protein
VGQLRPLRKAKAIKVHGTDNTKHKSSNGARDPADELLTEIEQSERLAALIVAYVMAETIDGAMSVAKVKPLRGGERLVHLRNSLFLVAARYCRRSARKDVVFALLIVVHALSCDLLGRGGLWLFHAGGKSGRVGRPDQAPKRSRSLAGATPFSASAHLRSWPNSSAGELLFRLSDRLLPVLAGPHTGVCQRHRGLVVHADVAAVGMDVLQGLRRTTERRLEGPEAGLLEALVDAL